MGFLLAGNALLVLFVMLLILRKVYGDDWEGLYEVRVLLYLVIGTCGWECVWLCHLPERTCGPRRSAVIQGQGCTATAGGVEGPALGACTPLVDCQDRENVQMGRDTEVAGCGACTLRCTCSAWVGPAGAAARHLTPC